MVIISECPSCKNFIANDNGQCICKAFPNGILDDVFWGPRYHHEHIDGDKGYLFEDKHKKESVDDVISSK